MEGPSQCPSRRCSRPSRGLSARSGRHRWSDKRRAHRSGRKDARARRRTAVGIAGIDGQRGNLLAIAQAEMRPGLARVGGFVNAVANGEIGAMQAFAAADIDDIGIGRSDGDGANGLRGLIVEDRIPGAAVVVGLPHAAVDLAHIENVGLAGHAGGSARAPAAERTDHAPAHFLVSAFGNLREGSGCEEQSKRTNELTKTCVRSGHRGPPSGKLRARRINQSTGNEQCVPCSRYAL